MLRNLQVLGRGHSVEDMLGRDVFTAPAAYGISATVMEAEDFIDLTFADIPYELVMLSEYIELLKNRLPDLINDEKQRIWQQRNAADDADGDVASHLQEQLDAGVTTRHMTAAALIAIWALYEAAVLRVARYIRNAKEISLDIKDLRGGLLDQARKYFDRALHFDLHPVGTDWHRLGTIATLRHALAHANGRLEDVSDPTEIQALAKSISGLDIVDDCLIVSIQFADGAREFIDSLVSELLQRVEATFQ